MARERFARVYGSGRATAIEANFRHAMVLSRGDSTVFVTSPLSSGLLAAAAIAIALIMLPAIRPKREEALKE